mmetsp:Transcript_46389/g.97498  ORF Transcript_46389/g.97498 Transcript_46389/m.97498 type:complete len:208 (-) Transcript_46389:927-1550(-)
MLLHSASDLLSLHRDESIAEDSTSLLQYFLNGRFDSTKYLRLRRRDYYGDHHGLDDPAEFDVHDVDEWGENDPPPPKIQKKKRQERFVLARRNGEGELEDIPPTESHWYQLYISCPQVNDRRFLQKFGVGSICHTNHFCNLLKMLGRVNGFRGGWETIVQEGALPLSSCSYLVLSVTSAEDSHLTTWRKRRQYRRRFIGVSFMSSLK